MIIKDIDTVKELLKPNLVNYLEQHGIEAGAGNFPCINPAHEDEHPSCGIIPGTNQFNCLACSCTGDLFVAAHFLEGKPASGPAFYTDTVPYLAERFGIKISLKDLSEEQVYESDTYRAYRLAASLLAVTPIVEAEIKQRGWTADLLHAHQVGSVSSYKDFRETLKHAGFTAKFLDEIDLGRGDIFNENNVVFTIDDEHGRPVGFSARNTRYQEDKERLLAEGKEPEAKRVKKYINQKTTGLRCNIYSKGSRFYGLDTAKESKEPIYIFEGQADVLTARKHGLLNCIGICGTALTTEHVIVLKKLDIFDIVLCLDGDQWGEKKVERLLDKRFAGHKEMRVHVVSLPDGEDPDSFIRSEGIERFRSLKKHSAFEWRLNKYPEDADPQVICRNMIPLIVNESSFIAQEDMCMTLSRTTGYSLRAIQAELDRLQNRQEAKKADERVSIINDLNLRINENPEDVEIHLASAQTQLYEVNKKYDCDAFSEDACVKALLDVKAREEVKDGSFDGFRLGSDLRGLEDALSGEWKKDVLLVLGGQENCGKSSLMSKIAFNLASHPENNACVIYHTIDDSVQQLQPKFVCVAEGSRSLGINGVCNPNYWVGNGFPDILAKRAVGYSRVESLMREGRLVVKGRDEGASLAYAQGLIKHYQDRYPERNVIYILDNFHILSDFQGRRYQDERVKYKNMSQIIKGMATTLHVPILATMEYRKIQSGARPTNMDILESGQMSYDANVIMHIYNEMHSLGESKSTLYHERSVETPNGLESYKLPTLELIFGKNKISSFKGTQYYDMWPASSDFRHVTREEIEARRAAASGEEEDENDG